LSLSTGQAHSAASRPWTGPCNRSAETARHIEDRQGLLKFSSASGFCARYEVPRVVSDLAVGGGELKRSLMALDSGRLLLVAVVRVRIAGSA
jgi:hypothetical protein